MTGYSYPVILFHHTTRRCHYSFFKVVDMTNFSTTNTVTPSVFSTLLLRSMDHLTTGRTRENYYSHSLTSQSRWTSPRLVLRTDYIAPCGTLLSVEDAETNQKINFQIFSSRGRTRTDTVLPPGDFKSPLATNYNTRP